MLVDEERANLFDIVANSMARDQKDTTKWTKNQKNRQELL